MNKVPKPDITINKMDIMEEDIFKFVFYPDELDAEKKNYLSKNEALFREQIEFCRSILNAQNNAAIKTKSRNIAEEILQKISADVLLPVKGKKSFMEKQVTLAAATTEAVKQSEAITFTDTNSKFLIRLIERNGKNFLYLFPKEEKASARYKITLYPSQKSYQINNPSEPIEIDEENSIQKILIEEDK